MATTYWEKIDERLANDPGSLKERVQSKYYEQLGAVRGIQQVHGWKHYDLGALQEEWYPRIILFRAPPGKASFGCVRIVDEDRNGRRGGILWDVFTSKDLAAVGIYTGILPGGFSCHLIDVELKMFTCYI